MTGAFRRAGAGAAVAAGRDAPCQIRSGGGLMNATFAAPAKLNLFLHVIGRRADGYHLLESVFQLVDFGDVITVAVRPDGQILRLTRSSVSLPSRIWRCARRACCSKPAASRPVLI